ncbi:hypothetical protein ACGFNU_27315 [Spirillospora sp. NPDC048911]|uniref:hypothetical protein n=1 Tax=Spirillospora sp. NPDC048911 TaxID=3364527 RepID=UPI00371ECB43
MSVRESIDPKSSLWAWLAFDLWFYRSQRGFSLAQAAMIVKVAQGTGSSWEAGRLRPGDGHMKRLDQAWDTGGHFERLLWYARTGGRLIEAGEEAAALGIWFDQIGDVALSRGASGDAIEQALGSFV